MKSYTLNSAQMCILEWILSDMEQETIEYYIQEQLNYQDICSDSCNEFFTESELTSAINDVIIAIDTSGDM